MLACGFSSMIQCPELGTMPPVTLLAANRISSAIPLPKNFSAPMANTGMVILPPLASNALLSAASWRSTPNCSKASCIACGRAYRAAKCCRVSSDPLGISGQLVPKAIEVDALPALYQTLFVRAPEVEVPQHRAANDVVPIAYSGQRCIDHHPARDPVRILCSQRIADHIADVMCDQVCLLDLERIHDAGNVDRLILLGVAGTRVIGHTHAAQVGDDHGMVLGQNNCQGSPHITRKTKAMQQHHG